MTNTVKIYKFSDNIKTSSNISVTKLEKDLDKLFVAPENVPESKRDSQYYRRRRYSPKTYQSYKSAVFDFVGWSGLENPFPTTVTTILEYLVDKKDLAPSTLNHRIAALSFVHRLLNYYDPTKDIVQNNQIRDVLGGIRKEHIEEKAWTEDQAPAIGLIDFIIMLKNMGNNLVDLRDKAYLLVSLLGAFRQSEVLNLTVKQLILKEEGFVIPMGIVKNNQLNEHKKFKVLPKLNGSMADVCPVTAINAWLKASGIKSGPIFRGIRKGKNKSTKIRETKLSHTSGNRILKTRLSAAGIKNAESYSSHSLRSTFITFLREVEVPDAKIIRQTHHKNLATLNIYDRPEVAFKNNPSIILAHELERIFNK